jgi:exosortase
MARAAALVSTKTVALHFALVLALAALVWPAFAHAVDVWSTDEEFTYGFLIPPIALAILWWRREALRRSLGHGDRAGLLVVIASIVALLVSRRTGINVVGGAAVSPLLIGMAAYLWGWRAARVLAFPSVFLIFGLGLYRGLLSSVGFTLQDVTAIGAGWTGRAIGLDVVRDGLVLHSVSSTPEFAFIVAQTCSGMSSLLSLLSLAALWMYATRGGVGGRLIVFAAVLPLVLVANTTRVTLVLLIASLFGQDAALGFFHGASSLILFGLALAGLLLVSRTVGCKLQVFATSS